MPILWNLNGIHRNQLIICLLLLFFCPWPLVTLIYVGILGYPVNEWEEERIGLTLEEYIDMYLIGFGFKGKEVASILLEQLKFKIDIQEFLTDYEVANAKTLY